ncbi:MAG: 5-formyltetrahydrofolate cyclo-ligase [Bacteroidota bacterium]|nr:5-formyltetrahydrofolate cyclo-ligase [Bacteroidota bacterium]
MKIRTKEEIRSQLLSIRNAMKGDETRRKSRQIFHLLSSLPEFTEARFMHTYVSSKKNEVDTRAVIEAMLERGKRVAVPIAEKERPLLRHSEIFSIKDFAVGAFGILEPHKITPVNLNEIEVVLVPAIGVDRTGARLGFGGGYYDSFLRHVSCVKIALAYDFQVVPELPREQHDERVTIIVTESEIIHCQ